MEENCYSLLSYAQAPSFVFVDEIDAIAGRHARNDPRRRGTFEAFISQLDGELVFQLNARIWIYFSEYF